MSLVHEIKPLLPNLKVRYLQGVPTEQLAREIGVSMHRLHIAFRRWLPLADADKVLHMDLVRRRQWDKSVLKRTTEASEG